MPELPERARIGAGPGVPRLAGPHRLEVDGFVETRGRGVGTQPQKLVLLPFYEVGANEEPYAVWLRTKPDSRVGESLFADGIETQSRVGNVHESFTDGDPSTLSNTFTGSAEAEDWYQVALSGPVVVGRIVFRHGTAYHDGGWFDTSGGKPRVQVQHTKDGPWETVGALDTYPSTDASRDPGLKPGQAFELRFHPTLVIGIRIVGKPSHGDNAGQSFSSCAELEAFAS